MVARIMYFAGNGEKHQLWRPGDREDDVSGQGGVGGVDRGGGGIRK